MDLRNLVTREDFEVSEWVLETAITAVGAGTAGLAFLAGSPPPASGRALVVSVLGRCRLHPPTVASRTPSDRDYPPLPSVGSEWPGVEGLASDRHADLKHEVNAVGVDQDPDDFEGVTIDDHEIASLPGSTVPMR
ncbi:hypothetical protein BH23ACT5_BH23ACT5_08670 [soil metagenome]